MPAAKSSTAPAMLQVGTFLDDTGSLHMRATCTVCSRGVAHRVEGVDPTISFKAYEEDLDEEGAPRRYTRSYQNMKTQVSYHGASRGGKVNPFHVRYRQDPAGWDAPPPDYADADRALQQAQHAKAQCDAASQASTVAHALATAHSATAAAEQAQAAADAFAAVASTLRQRDPPRGAAVEHAAKKVKTHHESATEAAARAKRDAALAVERAEEARRRDATRAERGALVERAVAEALQAAEQATALDSVEASVRRVARKLAPAISDDAVRAVRPVAADGMETAMRVAKRVAQAAASLYHAPSEHAQSHTWWCLPLHIDAIAYRLAMQEQRYAWVGELAARLAREAYPHAAAKPCGGWVRPTVERRLAYWQPWCGRHDAPKVADTEVPAAHETTTETSGAFEPAATSLAELCAHSIVKDPSRVLPTHVFRGQPLRVPAHANLHELLIESAEPVVLAEVPGLAFRMYFEIRGSVSMAQVVALVQRFDATAHAVESLHDGPHLRLVFPTLIVDRHRAALMREALLASVETPIHVASYDEPLPLPGTCRQARCEGCDNKPKARKQCPLCGGTGLKAGGRIGSFDDLDRLSIHADAPLTPSWARFLGCPSVGLKAPSVAGTRVKDERIAAVCQAFIRERFVDLAKGCWSQLNVEAVFKHHDAYHVTVVGLGSSLCCNVRGRADHPCSRIWFRIDREGFSQKCACKDPSPEGRYCRPCSNYRSCPKKLTVADAQVLFRK